MHLIKFSKVKHSEKILTQAVIQITQMLGIYHAELARILYLQCADIGELANFQSLILENSETWLQAKKFIKMYECLYQKYDGDEVKIFNWLRKENNELDGEPLYIMVDELRIDDVIKILCKQGE